MNFLLPRALLAPAAVAAALAAPAAAHAAQGWTAPQTLVDGPGISAALAVAPDGDAHAASSPGLFTAPAGALRFGGPASLQGASRIDSADLETDASGARHIAWRAGGEGFVSSAPAGGSFGAPQSIGPAVELDLAVAPDGTEIVVWRQRVASTDHRIRVVRRAPGASLGAPQDLATGVVASQVAAAIDDAGNAVALWRQIAGRYVVRAARSAGGAAFEAPQTVSQQPEGGTAIGPGAAFASTGVPVAVWSQTGNDAGVRAATVSGGGWTAPQAIGDGGNIAMAVDSVPGGGAVTAFDGGDQVVVASAGADGRFGGGVPIGDSAGQVVSETAVAVDDARGVHVAWGRPADGALLVAQGSPGGPFRALGQVDWVNPGAGALRMAAGGGGTAVLSWLRAGSPSGVLASIHRPGFTGNPPVGPRPDELRERTETGSGPAGAKLRLRVRTVRLGRRGVLAIRVSSDQAARATFFGRLTAPRSRRGPRLNASTRVLPRVALPARRVKVVRLKLGPAALRAVRRAVRAGRTVRLRVDVSTSTSAGAFAQQTLRATVRR